VWLIVLSDQLRIVALVSRYLTNKLIRRRPILERLKLSSRAHARSGLHAVLATVSGSYSPLEGRLPTRYSPVRHSTQAPKGPFSFDLHVLSPPPAFVLSQDQTLRSRDFEAIY
jgi:hypothetical protein